MAIFPTYGRSSLLDRLVPFLGFRFRYTANQAIHDLNERFKQHSIGYRYEAGKIVRLDNEVLHKNTVTDTLFLTALPEYKTANDNYIKAHEHYKDGNKRDCITWCGMAFESTIKIIAKRRNWNFDEKWTANKLIKLLFDQNFLPKFKEEAIQSFRGFLEQSLPTIRNNKGPHGEGEQQVIVPDSLTRYMLYVTGATIRLLIETQKEFETNTQRLP